MRQIGEALRNHRRASLHNAFHIRPLGSLLPACGHNEAYPYSGIGSKTALPVTILENPEVSVQTLPPFAPVHVDFDIVFGPDFGMKGMLFAALSPMVEMQPS